MGGKIGERERLLLLSVVIVPPATKSRLSISSDVPSILILPALASSSIVIDPSAPDTSNSGKSIAALFGAYSVGIRLPPTILITASFADPVATPPKRTSCVVFFSTIALPSELKVQ